MFDDLTNQTFTIVFAPGHDITRPEYAGRRVTVISHGTSFMPEVHDSTDASEYRIHRGHLQPA